MKKGPLSNKEKEYITANLSGFSGNMGELAETMNRSASVVQKFVDTLPKNQNSSGKDTGGLFARKKERGVTVMTEAASMAGDEGKTDRTPQTPPRYRQFIHKIKDSE